MQLTLDMNRLDGATRAWIEDETRRTGESIEHVIGRLIQRGVGVERQASEEKRFHDLDSLAGTWSAEEADAFRAVTADFSQVDAALWR